MPERKYNLISFLIKLEQLRGSSRTLSSFMENGSSPAMKRRLRVDISSLRHEYREIVDEARHHRTVDKRELHYGIRESMRDIRSSLTQARKAGFNYIKTKL